MLRLFTELILCFLSETNLDDVLQISNVFVNVSKGEVAKVGDLQKAFGTAEVSDVVKEVLNLHLATTTHSHDAIVGFEKGGSSSWRKRT